MTKNDRQFYVFKEISPFFESIYRDEISVEAEIASEIIAAYEKAIENYRDYKVLRADDPHLKSILYWYEVSKTRFYSLELTGSMCDLWYHEIFPLLRGDGSIVSCDLYDDIDYYLIDVDKIIKKFGDRSMLNFIDLDLSHRLKSAFDQYLDDCYNNVSDVFTNAFNLKVYH